MSGKEFEVESTSATGMKLVVRLSFRGDRFVTEIGVQDGDRATSLLESLEGNDNDSWPPSAPLQEVLKDENDKGVYLAAVGRAGKSHWSMVISPTDDGIEFDVACRIQTTPDGGLGSSYRALSATSARNSDRLEIPVPGTNEELLCSLVDTSCLEFDEHNQFRIAPQSSLEPLPQTIRWKYRFELRESPQTASP